MQRRGLMWVVGVLVLTGTAAAVPPTSPIGLLAGPQAAVQDLNRAASAPIGPLAKLLTTKVVLKETSKSLKTFAKEKSSRSFADELKALSKESKRFEKKLFQRLQEVGLRDQEDAVVTAYQQSADRARAELVGALSLGRAQIAIGAKDPSKALDKAEKALAKAAASETFSGEFKAYGKALKGVANEVTQLAGFGTGLENTWVLSDLTVAEPGQGVDMDGDGQPDNSLGAIQAALEAAEAIDADLDDILDSLLFGEEVVLFQFWGFDGYDTDTTVFGGIGTGTDTDGNPNDNFFGDETFDVSDSFATDGHPVVRVPTSFGPGGTYEFRPSGSALSFAGIEIPANSPVVLAGTADEDFNDGNIGFAIPVDALLTVVQASPDWPQDAFTAGIATALLTSFADIDLDGDGTNDAFSASLAFESVSAIPVQ